MSRKISVLLVAMFVFVVMVFTMGLGLAQDTKVIESKAGGVVAKAPDDPAVVADAKAKTAKAGGAKAEAEEK